MNVWWILFILFLLFFYVYFVIVARLPLAGGADVICCIVGSWFLSLLQDEHATTPALVVWASPPG